MIEDISVHVNRSNSVFASAALTPARYLTSMSVSGLKGWDAKYVRINSSNKRAKYSSNIAALDTPSFSYGEETPLPPFFSL